MSVGIRGNSSEEHCAGSFLGVFRQVMLPRSEGQLQVHAPPALLEHFSEDSSAEVFSKKLVAWGVTLVVSLGVR